MYPSEKGANFTRDPIHILIFTYVCNDSKFDVAADINCDFGATYLLV